ncbi:hypothetical protein AB0H73_17850 [Streptomyces olivoreticuli]|uniref:hypothetical protein n=1 Tax=Streptomyces olivoreticuli TaxID=68246 RepID=UPI000E27C1B6|nr:hypothetical protein [Streptomyces olivoreticuli]
MKHSPQGTGSVSVWYRTQFSGWMTATGFVVAAALLVIAVVTRKYPAAGLTMLLAPAAILATGAVKVTVSPRGVTVASFFFPFLRKRIPLDHIRQASARWTKPTELGGWGYRWKPGMRAVSLRQGDALWLALINGKQFVITVDDAGTAAELINGRVSADHGGR